MNEVEQRHNDLAQAFGALSNTSDSLHDIRELLGDCDSPQARVSIKAIDTLIRDINRESEKVVELYRDFKNGGANE